MKHAQIQRLRALREEMKAVARGERLPSRDAGKPSFNSVEAVIRLLTPENRRLLALIRDRKPESVAALAVMTGRPRPNLTRTLAKLEARRLRQDEGFWTSQDTERHRQEGGRRDRPVF